MRNKLLWLLPVITAFAISLNAQQTQNIPSTLTSASTSPGSIATDTSINFYLYAQRLWNNHLAPYENDSSAKEMIEQYQSWFHFWENRVCQDTTSGGTMFGTYGQALDGLMINTWDCLGKGGGNWSCVGPFPDYYNKPTDAEGRMHQLWIDPTDENHILAASASGGVWKTVNGGQNWVNITDGANLTQFPGTLGVDFLVVDPLNYNNIWLSTSTYGSTGDWYGRYGLGMMYSQDAGQTWQVDNSYRTATGTNYNSGWSLSEVAKLAYEPGSEVLYAIINTLHEDLTISQRRVLVKTSPTANWQDITPLPIQNLDQYYKISDFEFSNTQSGVVIFSTSGGATPSNQHLFRYDESYLTWIDQVLHFDTIWHTQGIDDLGLASNDKIYLQSGYGLYTCGATGSSVTAINLHVPPGNNNHGIVISPTAPNTLYAFHFAGSTPFCYISTDGGVTFPYNMGLGYTHADCRNFQIYKSGTDSSGIGDVIFACTDGGVAKKDSGTNTFHSITGQGLVVTQFSSVSSLPENDDILVAGAIDNGVKKYSKNNPTPWKDGLGGDGIMTKFSRNNTGVALSGALDGLNPNRLKYSSSTNEMEVDAATGEPTPNVKENYRQVTTNRYVTSFDNNNLATVGIHWLWQEALNTTNWLPAFGATTNQPKPKIVLLDSGILRVNKTIADHFISEKDPDVAYIAYNSRLWDPSYMNNDTTCNLFYTTNATSTPPTWNMVSPPPLGAGITSIAVDPQNPNRIWVAYGNVFADDIDIISALRDRRVYYSDNYGQSGSWQNVSKGLTAMPVVKLLYVEGSDDVLFAGTDVGVYRWNKDAQEWECFSNGMPRSIITDLDMNYCSGKLRASSYGRGLWESDYNPENPDIFPGVTTTIDYTTTWNSSQTFNGSIHIQNGATLTISGSDTRISMPKLGKITVDPGCKLIIDGATITNDCAGSLWWGIEVAGDNTQPEDPDIQGYLEIRNGATLSHARVAILNFDQPSYRCGGVIKVSDSHIDNCMKVLAINNTPNFSYMQSNGESNCSFTNTTFNKDDMNIPSDGDGFFAGWNILGGVVVKNCEFKYGVAWQDVAYGSRYEAIKMDAVGLSVQGCSFEGWCKGVYATDFSGLPSRVVVVDGNTFNHVSEAITMGGGCFGQISGNTITNMYTYLALDDSTIRDPVGIYLNSTKGTYVGCGNSVDGTVDGGPWPTQNKNGFATFYTGVYSTWVIANTFNNLGRGVQPQMDNPFLQVSCNSFNRDVYAMAINPQSSSSQFSFMDQGYGCGPTQDKAGNMFSGNSQDIASFLVNPWSYYAGNGSNEPPAIWGGNMTLNFCTNDGSNFCRSQYFDCLFSFDASKLHRYLSDYGGLSPSQKAEQNGQLLFGEIIRQYNYGGDIDGLQAFLESERNDQSTRLLIPLYVDRLQFTQATNAIKNLTLPTKEVQGYTDYYNLLMELKHDNVRPDSLKGSQLALAQSIAADSLEVSPYARALLEWGAGIEWRHIIEDIPSSDRSARTLKVDGDAPPKSHLISASPNPASKMTEITLFVSPDDVAHNPTLSIRDGMGKELYSQSLKSGDNSIRVNTQNLQPGIYFYSLIVLKDAIDTKKLSIVK